MVNRLIATGLLAFSLVWLAACGAGTGPVERDDSRGGTGVFAGNYEVIRYNEAGFPDPALNSTLNLALAEQGGQTALTISVRDSVMTGVVALDVRYDSGRVHPADARFHGVMGDDSQVLSASFLTQVPGVASLGQVGIHDYKPARLDGQFATVTFASGGLRAVSATDGVHTNAQGVGDIIADHAQNPIDDTPNLVASSDSTAGTARLSFSAAWHLADGNQNGIVEIADLAPIGKYMNASVSANWPAITADYDGNGIVSPAELSTMGKYLSEGTSTYLVEVGDDGATSGFTTVGTFDWSLTEGDDWTAPTDPNNPAVPSPIDLGTVFKTWNIDFSASSPFTFDQLSAVDTAGNQNGFVTFHVTPQRAGQNGVTSASNDIEVFVDRTRYITVNQVSIRVVGATGGTGDGSVFDVNNDAGSVVANSALAFNVEGIAGTYSSLDGGGPFSAGTLPADMTQQDYDDALALVRARAEWLFSNAGAPGFRYRSDWATFNPPAPAQGDPGAGTVFPDDDPESTGANAEGALNVTLDAQSDLDGDSARSIVFTSFTHDFSFDVTADPDAPIMADPFDLGTGQTATELRLLEGTQLQIDLTVSTPIADATQTQLFLYEIAADGSTVGNPIAFTYNPGAINQGEFFFRTVDPASIQAFVTGVNIAPDAEYHLAWNDAGGPSTSLNTPEPVLFTVPPPPPANLTTVPAVIGNPFTGEGGFSTFRIFHPDPEIRRGKQVTIDPLTGSLSWNTPEDQIAFNDILKFGANFLTTGKNGTLYPRVTVIMDDPVNPDPSFGPDLITAATSGLEDSGQVLVLQPHPNFLTVDCLSLPWETIPNTVKLAYKVFNVNDTAAGQGTLLAAALRPSDPAPFPVNWGVNVFDRMNTEDMRIDDLPGLYTNRTVNRASSLTSTPDVLWFQFSGGYVYDFSEFGGGNVKAVFEPWDGNGGDWSDTYRTVDLRVAGVVGTDFLAIYPIQASDFFEFGGDWIEGWSYVVHLDDPTIPGSPDSTYGIGNPDGDEYMMTVINNP